MSGTVKGEQYANAPDGSTFEEMGMVYCWVCQLGIFGCEYSMRYMLWDKMSTAKLLDSPKWHSERTDFSCVDQDRSRTIEGVLLHFLGFPAELGVKPGSKLRPGFEGPRQERGARWGNMASLFQLANHGFQDIVWLNELQPKFRWMESRVVFETSLFFWNGAGAWKTIIHSSKNNHICLYTKT